MFRLKDYIKALTLDSQGQALGELGFRPRTSQNKWPFKTPSVGAQPYCRSILFWATFDLNEP